ncbi:MAG TPA: hypothetical protein VEQ63_05715, partial [Bryobacteraceae bacterium]|nr:hypothetical protein [Bryobacteraceae bacterium]
VPVRSSQDVLLVRMAALMKVLDPDLLRENRDLFASIEPAAATVSNLKGVQDISESLPWKPVGSRSIT